MVVLHAVWSPSAGIVVWGEDPARLRAGQPASGRRHPFAAGAQKLWDAVPLAAPPAARRRDVQLTLPSTEESPAPSPAAGQPAPGGLMLRPWTVTGLSLDPTAAPDVLLQPTNGYEADSLRYVRRVVEFACEFASRGRVIPAVEGTTARWTVAPAPADGERLAALVRALPAALRAAAPTIDPRRLVNDLLDALTDPIAREAVPIRPSKPAETGAALLRSLGPGSPPLAQGDADQLGRTTQLWRESAAPEAGPLRTCFRLSPPAFKDDHWHVELLLQSIEDPSLVIDAQRVWESGRTLKFLKQSLEHPQERLLADLGRAVRLWPVLERALTQARPDSIELDLAEARHFLLEAAPALEGAGFGVLVPSWTKSRRLKARLKPQSKSDKPASSGLLGMSALADYRYEIALGDQSLSRGELEELARMKAPLVQVRGEWVLLTADDIEAAIGLLDREPPKLTDSDVLRLGLGLDTAPGGLEVDVDAPGALGELLDSAEGARYEAIDTPDGFHGELRPYQERGLGWLAFLDRLGLGGILADDMGLGKTIQLLALMVRERNNGSVAGPTLLICPMSVVGNWQREAARFSPGLTVHVHHGVRRKSTFHQNVREADLVLTTYGLAVRDKELLSSVPWHRVVCDEAQAVKNPSSKQAQAVRAIPSPRRLALTGTPVENRLDDLWSIMQFTTPGLLGSRDSFRERFAVPVERWQDEEAAKLLRRVTQPFVLRRVKTDRTIIADLPDKLEMNVLCNLTREQATLYQAVVDEMLKKVATTEGMERKGLILATMTRLKQICNHPAHYLGDGSRLPGRSGKLARIDEILEEVLASGERMLVFTQFAQMGHLLRTHLAETLSSPPPFLHGGVRKSARDDMVATFQAPSGAPVMLLSIKAGGVGLNLTAASHVVHFDRWWNPAVEDQATDRAFRIGQERNVQVRKLLCVGTLEERIDALISRKRDLAERIVGTGESWLTELSTDELRDLIALGADAVSEG